MRSLGRGVAPMLVLVALVGGPLPAFAQGQVEIKAPPPERAPRPEFIIPGQPPEVTRPREQDFYPDRIRSRHDPAFIVPFSTTVSTGPRTLGRFGLSAWTVPQGRGDTPWAAREIGGWFGFGFSFVWDIPLEAESPR
ncbi:MAG: hypothetical protein HYV92_07000 [Candidatus Rokubacteria bacterium]|nr:hypothetical protein [Candidatus Rokubacteria bacterium]